MQSKITKFIDPLKKSIGNKTVFSPGGAHLMYSDGKTAYTIEFQESSSNESSITSLNIVKRSATGYKIGQLEKILQSKNIDTTIGDIVSAEANYDINDFAYRINIYGTNGEQEFAYYEDIGSLEKMTTKTKN